MAETKAYLGKNPYIFISYAHKNKEVVYPFIAALQERYNVWFDEGIRYGQEWEDEITEKIKNCGVFIYMVTEESLASSNCKDEIHFARNLEKPFLNILVVKDVTLPESFILRYGRYQMCNLFAFSSCREAVADLANKCADLQIVQKEEQKLPQAPKETAEGSGARSDRLEANETVPVLRRVFLLLEDGDWAKADELCEQVLNLEPENANAYLGKLMVELQVPVREDLKNCKQPFDENNNYKRIVRFGDDELKAEMEEYLSQIKERNGNSRLNDVYNRAVNAVNTGKTTLRKIFSNQFSGAKNEKQSHNGKQNEELSASLVKAIDDGDTKRVLELVKAGADVNYIATRDNAKIPVLICAIFKGNEKMVEFLLAKGANPNCEVVFDNGKRYSALTYVTVEWPNPKIAKLLTKHGAKKSGWFF